MKNKINIGIILTAAFLFSSTTFAIVNSFPYLESFESGFGVWPDVASNANDFNWTRNTGQTPSPSTGPSGAYDDDWYIYTEASSHNNETTGLDAEFDFIELTNLAMAFYYHMYGSSMGSLHVDVYTGSWVLSVWSLTGQQQASEAEPWLKAEIDLGDYAGMPNLILPQLQWVLTATLSHFQEAEILKLLLPAKLFLNLVYL